MLYSTNLVLYKVTKKPRIYEASASSVQSFIALYQEALIQVGSLRLFSALRVDGGG